MSRPVGAWHFGLAFDDPARGTPIFLQIARALTDAIRDGRLEPGQRLPGSRSLARDASVHRNTVLAAYQELASEGWIEARHGRGTFVSEALPEPKRERSRNDRRKPPPAIGFDLPRVDTQAVAVRVPPPGCLLLHGGLPDFRLVPATALARAYGRLLRRSVATLSYGDERGHIALRRAVATMLTATRGLCAEADDVVITRGSQMALSLGARALLARGDTVAVEQLGYRPAWEALRQAGAKMVPLPVDEHGLKVDALEALCARRRVAAAYVTPHHQYPTTVPLSPGRRLQLIRLARERRLAILEDDYDHEFHYEGRPLLPLAATAPEHTVYVGTLSKVLAPGLRIGWVVAPRALLNRIAILRRYADRQGDHTVECAVAELMDEGELQRHLNRTRRIYCARRDHAVLALREVLGDELSFRPPNGGMALWARARSGIDVEQWLESSEKYGVSFQTGSQFAWQPTRSRYLRIGFGALSEDEFDHAVRRLERARRSQASARVK